MECFEEFSASPHGGTADETTLSLAPPPCFSPTVFDWMQRPIGPSGARPTAPKAGAGELWWQQTDDLALMMEDRVGGHGFVVPWDASCQGPDGIFEIRATTETCFSPATPRRGTWQSPDKFTTPKRQRDEEPPWLAPANSTTTPRRGTLPSPDKFATPKRQRDEAPAWLAPAKSSRQVAAPEEKMPSVPAAPGSSQHGPVHPEGFKTGEYERSTPAPTWPFAYPLTTEQGTAVGSGLCEDRTSGGTLFEDRTSGGTLFEELFKLPKPCENATPRFAERFPHQVEHLMTPKKHVEGGLQLYEHEAPLAFVPMHRSIAADVDEAVEEDSVALLRLALARAKRQHDRLAVLEVTRMGRLDALELLLRHETEGLDEGCAGCRPLHVAIQHCKEMDDVGFRMAEALLEYGASPDCLPSDGADVGGPLHVAAKHGCSAALALLFHYGADPNIPNQCGDAPLHSLCKQRPFHCLSEHKQTLALLLRNNANPSAMDGAGSIALDYAWQGNTQVILEKAMRQWTRRKLDLAAGRRVRSETRWLLPEVAAKLVELL